MDATLTDLAFRTRVTPEDPGRVRALTEATGFFRLEEVAIAVELVEERLAKGPASGYELLFAEEAGEVVGYACFGAIPLTRESHDLYWIAVRPGRQGRGVGRRLLARVEDQVRTSGGRRIYVDTSTRPQYAPTRAFYLACGYQLAAELPHFYAPEDGKAIFCKVL